MTFEKGGGGEMGLKHGGKYEDERGGGGRGIVQSQEKDVSFQRERREEKSTM